MSESKEDKTSVLLGMGNPLLDISAVVPKEFLEKYELAMNNAILAEPKHLPMYAEMEEKFEVQYIAGGATLNSIRVAQWLAQSPLYASYIGCVGKDKHADQLRSAAEADGVGMHCLVDEATPTGTCAVLINDFERSLCANISAANNYKKEHLMSEPMQAVLKSAQVVYSSGFFLTVSPESMIEAGKHCAETGKTYCFNLGAPFLSAVFKDAMQSVMPYVDIVFGNESEAAAYAEVMGYAGASMGDIAINISRQAKASGGRGRVVVITQGSESTLVCKDGKVTEFAVTRLAKDKLVDLNGAGDAFVGGFLFQYTKGADLAECVRCGHWAATYIIQQSGCTVSGTPDFE